MRIMKCILISFIIVNLTFQGFPVSVFAANIAGEIEKLNITLEIHDMLQQPGFTGFILKVKPLTINEQVLLKTIEAKTNGLLNQAAGAYYEELKRLNTAPLIDHPMASDLIDGALIGALIGWLISSGRDIVSIRRSSQIGALCGVVIISILYVF